MGRCVFDIEILLPQPADARGFAVETMIPGQFASASDLSLNAAAKSQSPGLSCSSTTASSCRSTVREIEILSKWYHRGICIIRDCAHDPCKNESTYGNDLKPLKLLMSFFRKVIAWSPHRMAAQANSDMPANGSRF
jgi:hypothetical protein